MADDAVTARVPVSRRIQFCRVFALPMPTRKPMRTAAAAGAHRTALMRDAAALIARRVRLESGCLLWPDQ
jgi:hypothetical protein